MKMMKIDMRNIVSEEYQHSKKISGILAFDGHHIVECELNHDFMTLVYPRQINGLFSFIAQYVPIDSLPQQDGTESAYFLCPACGKRTLVLYHQDMSLLCRKCSNLTEKSEYSLYGFTKNKEVSVADM